MSLQHRNAIVTGANRGLGKAIAQAFINTGANVLICARDADLLEGARQELSVGLQPTQKVVAYACDVSKEDDVNRLAICALEQFGQIQILVNNAGVYGPKGPIETVDWAEWCKAIEINLFGVVLLTRAVLPSMKNQRYGKIINISGGGATNPLPNFSAYAASKASVVRLTETIAEEVRGTGVDVNAVAPGALNTRLLDEVIEAGPEKVGDAFHKRMVTIKKQGGVPLEIGANLCVFLASPESDGITGKLLSAQWDPWEQLPQYFDALNTTDIYTLRRIVPKDRDMDWGER